jgi:HK97 family phage major capsid protein
VISLDFITDMYYALPEKHRRNAIWSGPDTIAAILSKVVDGNGRPIFSFASNPAEVVGDNDAVGQVGTLFRRPFINMPGQEGVGEDKNRLYFSAMDRTFAMLEKGGIRAESSRDFKFTSDLTTFKFVRRVDGQPIGNRTAGLPFDYVYGGNLT